MGELYDLTLAKAARGIREGEFSSVALVQSLFKRIDVTEPHIRAWVTLDREAVLDEAEKLDRDLEKNGPRGPLHGVPVGLKDIIHAEGMKTTAGSKVYADHVPGYNATAVTRLKEAGAIIQGKVVTCEFALSDPSPTRNPWNPEYCPGGSSSGSATSVATRMTPATLGTQTGGSTCRPAAYNGIVGLKPTYGRISRYGVIPVSWSLDTVGILVRSVEDAAIMLGVMAGHDPHDPSSSKEPVPDYRGSLDGVQAPPRIGLIREFFLEKCTDEVRKNTEDVAQKLGQAGATIEEIALPKGFESCYAPHRLILNTECAAVHEEMFKKHADDYGPRVRGIVESAMLVPAVRYLQAQRIRRGFRDEMVAIASKVDALLTPTTPTPAPRDLNITGDPLFQTPWTFATIPTITIPSGLSESGLPMGVQFEGLPFGEPKLLAVAHWSEAVLGLDLVPPSPR